MSKALKAAIEANDPEAVQQALKGVKDINRKLPDARTPLLHACEKGADRVLEVLFETGAIAEKKHTFPGDTPFAVAVQNEQAKVIEKLWTLKRVSQSALEHAMEMAAMDGREKALELILETVKPPITIGLFRLATASSRALQMIKLLVRHGGDVNARHDGLEARHMTVFHDRVGSGKVEVIRTLVECGADINARDALGRTPLMILCSALEGIEVSNARAKSLAPLIESGAAKVHGDKPKVRSGLEAVQVLLELGADATCVDNAGNDALDHYQFEYRRWDKKLDPAILETLRQAGAKGSKATQDLFEALRKKNLQALRAAIKAGADVNRLTPPSVPVIPLISAAVDGSDDSLMMVQILLESGADSNKYAGNSTPLIYAARCGYFEIVKALVAAGADLHAVELRDEFPDNAYSAADGNSKPEIADYLKSLGATKPKPTIVKPLEPGVESWNDFSELLVKSTVQHAAEALAKMIGGKVHLNAYGESFKPGKQAYVVVRPAGMNWCNVFRITPPPSRFGDSEKTEAFVCELAKASGTSALSIEYSDTSDAAAIFRAEPDGKTTRDAGWDHAMLQEIVGALGNEAPAWAKKQLAGSDEDDPTSTERLELLAAQEKFVVAAFGLDCEPGCEVEIDFTGYAAEVFDGVAFVSN